MERGATYPTFFFLPPYVVICCRATCSHLSNTMAPSNNASHVTSAPEMAPDAQMTTNDTLRGWSGAIIHVRVRDEETRSVQWPRNSEEAAMGRCCAGARERYVSFRDESEVNSSQFRERSITPFIARERRIEEHILSLPVCNTYLSCCN